MNPLVLSLYHRLPAPLRSAAASLRGWYLNRWRYSAYTESLIEETLSRDQWSAEQWTRWREERLQSVLQRAVTKVPYYRDHWEKRRRLGDRASWELLENWPVLEKDAVRADPHAFLADDCDARNMFCEHTSGTTGTPLRVWRSRATVAQLYGVVDARTWRWDRVPAGTRWARIGGQLVAPLRQRRPPFWVWNLAMRQLYMSSYHLAPDLIPHYLDALVQYRIRCLSGYPSALHALAERALRLGRRDLQMTAIYTNAEPLYDEQRRTIAAAFQCPVRQTYGMAETVAAASECPAGRLHQWPEFGAVEHIGDGELVCTGLLNPDMPLIRYRVGDRGRTDPVGAEPCACGRTLPTLGILEGRTNDVLVTSDGRQVVWINPVFYGMPTRESQIEQEQLQQLCVRVAPAPGFTDTHEQTIVARLRERMGDVTVRVERVDVVPRSANGKVRAVISSLSAAERAQALRSPA
ncbi:MAG: AMP-binding protein [Gemmatimonadales bacterium]|nr:AMP-binding protein [Gemmatimonadales bacterium]